MAEWEKKKTVDNDDVDVGGDQDVEGTSNGKRKTIFINVNCVMEQHSTGYTRYFFRLYLIFILERVCASRPWISTNVDRVLEC